MNDRAWKALIVVGGIVAVMGLYGLVSAFMVRNSITTEIPAGPEWFLEVKVDVLGGGSLRVDYEATMGTVDVFVLTEAQYDVYVNVGPPEALYTVAGSSAGAFDVSLPGTGRYYVTIDHGRTYEGVVQEVQMTVRLLGIEPAWFVGGLAFVGIGILILAFGVREKRKAMGAGMPLGQREPPRAPPSDVTFYVDRTTPKAEPPAPPPDRPVVDDVPSAREGKPSPPAT